MMKKCAFLTMYNLLEKGFKSDDEIVIPYFNYYGWQVECVPWSKDNIEWSDFSAVIIRSTWDYQNQHREFLSVLEKIKYSGTPLANPFELVRWNSTKNYLLDLRNRGIPIPTTIKGSGIDEPILTGIFDKLMIPDIIIKPIISANADKTFRISRENYSFVKNEIMETYREREFLAQPFRKNILTEGEYSLFFFNNEISHAAIKTPKAGDFRVQEEHGGKITGIKPTRELVDAGKKVLKAIGEKLLYSRIDLVRNEENQYELMELEAY